MTLGERNMSSAVGRAVWELRCGSTRVWAFAWASWEGAEEAKVGLVVGVFMLNSRWGRGWAGEWSGLKNGAMGAKTLRANLYVGLWGLLTRKTYVDD